MNRRSFFRLGAGAAVLAAMPKPDIAPQWNGRVRLFVGDHEIKGFVLGDSVKIDQPFEVTQKSRKYNYMALSPRRS